MPPDNSAILTKLSFLLRPALSQSPMSSPLTALTQQGTKIDRVYFPHVPLIHVLCPFQGQCPAQGESPLSEAMTVASSISLDSPQLSVTEGPTETLAE